jgi:hypothetical protein
MSSEDGSKADKGTALLSLALAGGLGSFLSVFFQMYGPEGKTPQEIAYLLTVPNLAIGLGVYISPAQS